MDKRLLGLQWHAWWRTVRSVYLGSQWKETPIEQVLHGGMDARNAQREGPAGWFVMCIHRIEAVKEYTNRINVQNPGGRITTSESSSLAAQVFDWGGSVIGTLQ